MQNSMNHFGRCPRLAGTLGLALLVTALIGALTPFALQYSVTRHDTVAHFSSTELDRALASATSRMQIFAHTEPERFAAVLQQAFGARLDARTGHDLVQKAIAGQMPLPQRIVFVPSAVLAGAGGAYASEDGGIMFLDASIRAADAELVDLITHEWGHHLDATLGAGDAPGEEGEIFLLGQHNGGPIAEGERRRLAASGGGHATIDFEGRALSVELGCGWNPFCHVGNAVSSVATWVGGAVGTVAKGAVSITRDVLKAARNAVRKAHSLIKNGAKAIGNTVKGAVTGALSAVTRPFSKSLSDNLANTSKKSFGQTGSNLKNAGGNVLNLASAPGNLINKTSKNLDKIAPGLGTVGEIGVGLTPAGPMLAGLKGAADTINGFKNGGLKGGLLAGTFAGVDIALSKIGRTTKGLKVAQRGQKEALEKAATDFAKRSPNMAKNAKPLAIVKSVQNRGLANTLKDPGLGEALKSLPKRAVKSLGKAADTAKAKTPVLKNLDSYPLTRATRKEIAQATKLSGTRAGTALGVLGNSAVKIPLSVATKGNIPGRDRDSEGRLLGSGGNENEQTVDGAKALPGAIVSALATPAAASAALTPPAPPSPDKPPAAPAPPRALVLEVQELLGGLGYEPGPVDGAPGRKTYNAVKAFQSAQNKTPTGTLSPVLLDALRIAIAEQRGSVFTAEQAQARDDARFEAEQKAAQNQARQETRNIAARNDAASRAAALEQQAMQDAQRQQQLQAATYEQQRQQQLQAAAYEQRRQQQLQATAYEQQRQQQIQAAAYEQRRQQQLQATAYEQQRQQQLQATAYEQQRQQQLQATAYEQQRQRQLQATAYEQQRQRQIQAAAQAAAPQQQAAAPSQVSCYFNESGHASGTRAGNGSANGALGINQAQRLAYQGQYAFIFIVQSNGGQFRCPSALAVQCNDCPPGAPTW